MTRTINRVVKDDAGTIQWAVVLYSFRPSSELQFTANPIEQLFVWNSRILSKVRTFSDRILYIIFSSGNLSFSPLDRASVIFYYTIYCSRHNYIFDIP
jgi:hypothetical protein